MYESAFRSLCSFLGTNIQQILYIMLWNIQQMFRLSQISGPFPTRKKQHMGPDPLKTVSVAHGDLCNVLLSLKCLTNRRHTKS